MIPAKIITKSQAVKLGLAKPTGQKISGVGGNGAGALVKVNASTGEETVLESYKDEGNGVEITFMNKDRTKYLKDSGSYDDYIKQFKKVSGIQE